MNPKNDGWRSVYRVVNRIPKGCVATYGQVAAVSGMPRAARQIGWALAALNPEDDVPWQRVINASGEVSPRGAREYGDLQRALLESEGVEFDLRGRVDLGRFGWQPRVRRGLASEEKPTKEPRNEPKKMATKKSGPTREKKPAKKPVMKTKTSKTEKTAKKAKAREPGRAGVRR